MKNGFILFLMSICLVCQAQMTPTMSTVKTPYGNVNNTTWNNTGTGTMGLNIVKYPEGIKTKLTVVLASDSIFSDNVMVDIYDSVHRIIVPRPNKKGGDIILRPGDTKQISQIYNGRQYVGIPADSCWLYKVISAPISSYAPIPTENKEYFTAIQMGNDPIVPMTRENLIPMVGDNPQLLKLIEKGKLAQAVWRYNESK